MRQRGSLCVAHVLEQTPGGADGEPRSLEPEAREIVHCELLAERARGGPRLEMPRRTRSHGGAARDRVVITVGEQQLSRTQPLELRRERLASLVLEHIEATACELEPSEPEARPVAAERGEQRRAPFLEQRFLGDRARRHDAHDLAIDRALRLGRVTDLLADRDGLAAAQRAREIRIDGLHGDPGHRYRRATRLAARGQRDVEQARGPARVIEEELVEIAHPVEEQLVRMLRLDAQVLLHDRAEFLLLLGIRRNRLIV